MAWFELHLQSSMFYCTENHSLLMIFLGKIMLLSHLRIFIIKKKKKKKEPVTQLENRLNFFKLVLAAWHTELNQLLAPVWIRVLSSAFALFCFVLFLFLFFFFFKVCMNSNLQCSRTCAFIVQEKKCIVHRFIHIFKNYFVIMFLVFSKISCI